MAAKQKPADIPEIIVTPAEFDPSRLVFGEPVKKKFAQGSTCNSQIYYLNDDGEKCLFWMPAIEGSTFGVSEVLKERTVNGDKKKMVTGYQFSYSPVQQKKLEDGTFSAEEKTDEEVQMLSILDDVRVKIAEEATKRLEDEDEDSSKGIPEASQALLSLKLNNKKKGSNGILDAVKPLYILGYKTRKTATGKYERIPEKEGGGIDPKKSPTMYVELATKYVKDDLPIITTKFYPVDSEDPVNPLNYVEVSGKIQPVLWFESLYWGSHGDTPYGVSCKVKCVEAVFRMFEAMRREVKVPEKRIIPRPARSQDDEDEGEPTTVTRSVKKIIKDRGNRGSSAQGGEDGDDEAEVPNEDDDELKPAKATKSAKKVAPKKASAAATADDDVPEEEDVPKKPTKKASAKKSAPPPDDDEPPKRAPKKLLKKKATPVEDEDTPADDE